MENVSVKDMPKHYPVKYARGEYTFPSSARIEAVRFDDRYIHLEFVDQRILSVPLQWIPPLRDATPRARQKFRISPERTMLIWDPDVCGINAILHIADSLQPDSGSKR